MGPIETFQVDGCDFTFAGGKITPKSAYFKKHSLTGRA